MDDVILTVAKNGSEAIELFNVHSFNMVLSSLTIPGMDGLQFIRKLAAFKQRPALALLDHSSRRIMVNASLAARNLGFTVVGFVSKSMDVKALRGVHEKCAGLGAAAQAKDWVSNDPVALLDALGDDQIGLRFKARINLRSGRITAVTAIAFRSPAHSELQAPTDSLPATSNNELDEKCLVHVVGQVITAQRVWRESGCKVSVWIKLPIPLLGSSGFADRLHQFVVRHDGEPEYIGFELIRSSKNENLIHHIESIYQLRFKGFGVAHDDCGQGYRSFLNLKLTPFTDVKIFSTLVRSAVRNEKMASSLACIISESQQLGLTVTAEGVSTQEELSLLQRLNCDEAQGPLICEAVHQDVLIRLLEQDGLEGY
jgi:EAL domain-containing protein (putative c-di-GMP-specific phosphodiesterase class I)